MNIENMTERKGEHGVITDIGDVFFDGGYESFSDAVNGMLNKWKKLHVQQCVTIAERDYCNEFGGDYMTAVGFYDEETGEAWESMTLAEAIEILEAMAEEDAYTLLPEEEESEEDE